MPSYHDLFFTHYMTVLELVTFLGQFPLILLHELAHALAGRRLGLRTRLSIDRRMYYVVFVTEMDGLVTVPRRKRYVPMLAGMLTDLLVLAVLILVADVTRRPDGALSLAGDVALAFAYMTLLRLAWQFFFYLQTDLYFVIVTVLGCVDLQGTARRVLARAAGPRPAGVRLGLVGLGHVGLAAPGGVGVADLANTHPRDLAVARGTRGCCWWAGRRRSPSSSPASFPPQVTSWRRCPAGFSARGRTAPPTWPTASCSCCSTSLSSPSWPRSCCGTVTDASDRARGTLGP